MNALNPEQALKEAIAVLEIKRRKEAEELKAIFHETCQSLKPGNLMKLGLREVTEKGEVRDNLINTSIGVAAGFLSKKLIAGGSAGLVRKGLGSLAQLGVTYLVSRDSGGITSAGINLLSSLFGRKKKNAPEEEEDEEGSTYKE